LNLRQQTINWLFWASATMSPQFKLFGFFYKYCPHPNPYCVDRYARESTRILAILEEQLGHNKHWVMGGMCMSCAA
jgi:glutathione S-transferase